MADLTTELFSIQMPSPLILASGPRSYNAEGVQKAFDSGAGGVVTKTLRLQPAVNPTPHITLAPKKNLRNTLFNSEQWSDLTWLEWVNRELPALAGHPGALIVSLGHTPEEVAEMVEGVVASGVVDILECVAYTSDDLVPMVEAIRQRTDIPLLAKLTFNWGERFFEIAEQALEMGVDGFTAIDSIGPTLSIDIESGQPMLSGIAGKTWMSGAAIKPVAVAMVAQLTQRFGDVPIVGTGGVITTNDAMEMLMAGASAVGACTAPILQGVGWFSRINQGLNQWLDEHGHPKISSVCRRALQYLPQHDDNSGLSFEFNPGKCTLCEQCVVVCPYDARILKGKVSRGAETEMVLDKRLCRACGLCSASCVTGALISDWPK